MLTLPAVSMLGVVLDFGAMKRKTWTLTDARRAGARGAKVAMQRMTQAQRTARARKAAMARWANHKKEKPE